MFNSLIKCVHKSSTLLNVNQLRYEIHYSHNHKTQHDSEEDEWHTINYRCKCHTLLNLNCAETHIHTGMTIIVIYMYITQVVLIAVYKTEQSSKNC